MVNSGTEDDLEYEAVQGVVLETIGRHHGVILYSTVCRIPKIFFSDPDQPFQFILDSGTDLGPVPNLDQNKTF